MFTDPLNSLGNYRKSHQKKIHIIAVKANKGYHQLSTKSESFLECGKHINRETRSAKASTEKPVQVKATVDVTTIISS